jgi:hypothetical protein
MGRGKPKSTGATVISPRSDVFQGKSAIDLSITRPGIRYFIFDHAEYPAEGGIYVYYKGMLFPRKGFPTPESTIANDMVKRLLRTMFYIAGTKDMILAYLGLALTPWKFKKRMLFRAIAEWNRTNDWILSEHYLKRERYCKTSRGIWIVVSYFLQNLELDEFNSELAAKITANIFEYDDSYRYMLQDIVTEAKREVLIKKPRRELKRLLKIFCERQIDKNTEETVKKFGQILLLAMLHPKIRKAFVCAIRESGEIALRVMTLDNADRYHILNRNNYNFLGRTYEERKNIYLDYHIVSECCREKVQKNSDSNSTGMGICLKCKKVCKIGLMLPPEMIIAEE